jgi:hypothetical protein
MEAVFMELIHILTVINKERKKVAKKERKATATNRL